MAKLALITPKFLKACKVLEGHELRIISALKRRALVSVPQKKSSKRPSHASSFMELHKKQHTKEARQ